MSKDRLSARFRFLRASALAGLEKLPSFEDLQARNSNAWFGENETPALVLFVSHRWEAVSEPDPSRRQLRALQQFTRQFTDVAAAVKANSSDRSRIVPSPFVHGTLQALMIIGAANGSEDDRNQREWNQWVQAYKAWRETPDAQLLDNVGFWYDYSCMPQSTVADSATGPVHPEEVKQALLQLGALVSLCPLLILRWANDSYDGRAWCAAELAVGREAHKHIVLRTDLLGRRVKRSELEVAADPFANLTGTSRLLRLLDGWTSPDREIRESDLYVIHFDYAELSETEIERDVPFWTTRARPEVFRGQKRLLLHVMEQLGAISERDRKYGNAALADVKSVVENALRAANLACTVPDDGVFVGLSILEARHAGAPDMAAFYRSCISRWLNGQTLRLLRYREAREGRHVQVWYVFDDENPASRPRPKWVKEAWWRILSTRLSPKRTGG